jgi:predicted SAM-dependent methyltransferase
MANEATKFRTRWQREGLWEKYIVGKQILDIGCGADPITPDARGWDIENGDGDGQLLVGVADESFDVVYSSHFIEHLHDPLEGLLNQWRVLRQEGYLIFQVPDEDLYEQGCWPGKFNDDHKHTFTISKALTWSPASKSVVNLVQHLPNHKIISMRIIDTNYDHEVDVVLDQTADPTREAAIECIIQKNLLQPSFKHGMKIPWLCPRCGHMEFICRGITPEGTYDVWCKNCGRQGKLSLRENS